MRKRFGVPGLVLLLLGLLLAGFPATGPVHAGTVLVNTLADTSGAGCTSTVTSCSLREALGVAASGDVISFVVTGTITLNPTLGPLVINKNVTISGPGAGSLTVSGNNAISVFTVGSPTPSTVTLSGLTIQGGSTTGSGGGLNLVAGTVTLSNVTVGNNTAGNGGGINNSGTMVLNNVTVSGNTASGTGAHGGGILNRTTGTLTVNNSIISGNTVSGTSSSGGGLFNGGTLLLVDGVLSGNTAPASGAGGGFAATGLTTIRRTAILNNSGGGGLLDVASSSIVSVIDNTTFGNNTCSCDGSAILALEGAVNVTAATIANNTAAPGLGAVFSSSSFLGGTVTFRNSILAGNSGPNLSPPNVGAPRFISNGSNLSSDASSNGVFTNTGDQNNTNPLLGPLAPCGPGQAFFPQPGSPAIGTGNSGLSTDQCGTTRVAPDTKGAVYVTISVVLSNTPTATVTATRTATATLTASPVAALPSNTPTSTATSTSTTGIPSAPSATSTSTPAAPNATPTSTPTATPASPLQVKKVGVLSPQEARSGDYFRHREVAYTVWITNVGDRPIQELFGTDTASFPHTSFGSSAGVLWRAAAYLSLPNSPFPLFQPVQLDDDGQGFNFRLGSLPPGATLTFEVSAIVLNDGTVTNTITVEAQGLSQPMSATATITVPAAGFSAPAAPPGGAPCTPPANCPIEGGARGSWQGGGSGVFTVQATAPAGTAVGSLPIITLVTTAGVETRPCGLLTASLQATCTGTTVGNLRLGPTVAVLFPSPAGGITSVTGTVIAPGAGAPGVGVSNTTLVLPPLLPPLLPPPPLPLLPPPPPFMPMPPADLGPAAPEVPVIPEAPSSALVLATLVGLGALGLFRRR